VELIHGFPYALPPPAPLPAPPAGVARLESWSSAQQIRNGTGIGNVSRSGWWIPTEVDVAAAQAQAGAATRPWRATTPATPATGAALLLGCLLPRNARRASPR
jgi:hypothetical protein